MNKSFVSGRFKGIYALMIVSVLCAGGCMLEPSTQPDKMPAPKSGDFTPSTVCQNCHGKIYAQQADSWHALAYGDQIFQAQYFNELIPLAQGNEILLKEADKCIACHAPIAYLDRSGHITSREQLTSQAAGVNCDFCHSLKGYEGDQPGGGNYISSPGETKKGPLTLDKAAWHREYSEFHTKSEFCGTCHNDISRFGVEIKSTFSEWEKSSYAGRKISCQDCHMNLVGFLVRDKAVFERGRAASMTLGQPPVRSRLYSHFFPGGHEKGQISNAIVLDLEIDRWEASPGEDVILTVNVRNEKVGHSMPSGSGDLRLLWLELYAQSGNAMNFVPIAEGAGIEMYGVAGRSHFDREFTAADVREGSRVYRTIFADENGVPTQSSYNAAKIVFDNRLKADELRKETYHFRVPHDAGGSILFTAMLNYQPYPSSFAKRLGIAETAPVKFGLATKKLAVRRN